MYESRIVWNAIIVEYKKFDDRIRLNPLRLRNILYLADKLHQKRTGKSLINEVAVIGDRGAVFKSFNNYYRWLRLTAEPYVAESDESKDLYINCNTAIEHIRYVVKFTRRLSTYNLIKIVKKESEE